jgi:hypothetical protein
MQSLERRIAELEKASSTGEGPMTIIIRCMAPGNLEVEIQELHDSKGSQQWKRQLGEAEQEFIDRASREVSRDGPGCALLIAGSESLPNQGAM